MTFKLVANDQSARAAVLQTEHGSIVTPAFMSVGTFGSTRFLTHSDLEEIDTQVLLGNTYHLYLRPGAQILEQAKGYHNFIHWNRPILTDSGGFQVFSLASQRTISEKGVTFKSYIDHSKQFFSPESNVEFQEIIGSDIMMVLDECVPSTSPYAVAKEAADRTSRWAERAQKAYRNKKGGKLFAIVQGALFEELRRKSAQELIDLNFEGYALGGLAVGETLAERQHFTNFSAGLLPWNKPRYLMGVGTPLDLLHSIASGIDIFDCIIPTNHAGQGVAYTFSGKKQLRQTKYKDQLNSPIEPNCHCKVCRRYSTAYLHQILKSGEPTAGTLIAFHNTWFYERLMRSARHAILTQSFSQFSTPIINAYSSQSLDI